MTASSKPHRNVPPPPGAAGAKPASVYARFIPREELSAFAAWNPDALFDAAEAGPDGTASATVRPGEEGAAKLRGARQSGYQDGYRDGMVALEAFKQSFASQLTAQLGGLTAAYGDELDALHQQMAQALARTATQLARQIVRSELVARPELIASVAQEAVDTLLMSARHITLRVHPDDHALVQQGTGETLAARGARLVSDATLTRGGLRVESDISVIDASVETRWQRAAAALGCESAWSDGAAE